MQIHPENLELLTLKGTKLEAYLQMELFAKILRERTKTVCFRNKKAVLNNVLLRKLPCY